MRQGCRGSFRRTPRRMIRRTPRRTPRRPVPRTGSRRRAPARQAAAARLRGKFRHALPFRRASPGGSCPAGRTRRPVPRTGSRRRTPRAATSVTPRARRAPRPLWNAACAPQARRKKHTICINPRFLRPSVARNAHGLCCGTGLGAPKGSACPVGTCHRRWQSDPNVGARRGRGGPGGCPPRWCHRDPMVGSETRGGRGQRPPRRLSDRESAPNPGRRGGKRVPCGHLGRRPKATRSAPEGSVSPVGCCAQRKATRRCEQIQGLCAAAHRTPIFARAAKP